LFTVQISFPVGRRESGRPCVRRVSDGEDAARRREAGPGGRTTFERRIGGIGDLRSAVGEAGVGLAGNTQPSRWLCTGT
jgi:hypothetical protein